MLTTLENVEVVAETGDGREALDLIHKHRPDVAFVDITMPSLTGLEVARRTAKEMPAVRVIIVSMHTTEDYIGRAIRAGVAYVNVHSTKYPVGEIRAQFPSRNDDGDHDHHH